MGAYCQRIEPKNGQYLTADDFEQWQDYFGRLTNNQSCSPDMKAKTITFVVTEKCNLACTYCYETHKTNSRMTQEIAKQAVDFLFDKEKINGYYDQEATPGVILEFIGGEPLLEIDLMDYIVEYFKFKAFEAESPWATNYMINFTTNGILFNAPKVQDFFKRNPGRISATITIDGNKELHDSCRIFPDGRGSYDIVIQSLEKWLQVDSRPRTKLTLSPSNIQHLFEAVKNVWDLGIIGVFANCVYEEGWTETHAQIYNEQLVKLANYIIDNELYRSRWVSLFDDSIGKLSKEDKNWCGGNGEMLAIGPDGRCFPCIRFMKYSLSTPGREEQSIGDIWNGLDHKERNPWLKRLTQITMSSQSPPECLECEVASGCSLCTGYNYDKFGDPNIRATFICVMHKTRVRANKYFWDRLDQRLRG